MRRLGVVLLLLLFVLPGRAQQTVGDLPSTLILLSFDAFRWDYPDRFPVPALQQLARRGLRADGLIPAFPSKTFPNHYSIVTGLYPGHHGIVANNMWNADEGRAFTPANGEARQPEWWGGEPLWVTAQRAGQRTASLFWIGSEAPIRGVRPTYWLPYDEGMPGTARVDQVLRWLDLPGAERPTFIAAYFEDADQAGHRHGPDSPEVRAAAMRADGYLRQLADGLAQRGILDRVNLVVVSDHGLAATDDRRVILIDDYISLDDAVISDINPTVGIFPKPGKADAVYQALVRAHPHLKIYRREETPARWHYRDHPRVPPIVGVADEGWQVMRRATLRDMLARVVAPSRGQHGYDPRVKSMRGIFVAAGPAFRRGRVAAFENVHLYNALARVLGVMPAPNDGDPRVAARLLR